MSHTPQPKYRDPYGKDYWRGRYEDLRAAVDRWLDGFDGVEHTGDHDEMEPDPSCPLCCADALETTIAIYAK